jgi:transposase InsO family protein
LTNSKLKRWQTRLAEFKFCVEYVEGRNHVFADMLSRPFDRVDTAAVADDHCAGQFYKFGHDDRLKIYIPSWVFPNDKFKKSVLLEKADHVSDLFTVKSIIVNDQNPRIPILEMREIEQAQSEDPLISSIRKLVAAAVPVDKWTWPDDVYGALVFKKHASSLSIHDASKLLIIDWGGKSRIVLPESLVAHYCKSAHDLKAHLGVDRTAQFLSWCWWPHKMDDIRTYVASCANCLKQKGYDMQPSRPDRKHLYRASRNHEIVYCDFVSLPTSSSSGKRYALTVMCGFSRWLQVYATHRCRSIDAARGLMRYFLQFDFPRILSSDRGRHFENELLADLCSLLKIKQNLHCAYRPESSGVIERCHKVLKSSLWAMVRDDPRLDWELALPSVVSAMNRSTNAATKISPYKCIFGRDPSFNGISLDNAAAADPNSYAQNTAELLEQAHKLVKLSQAAVDRDALERGKSKVQPEEITAGHFVMLKREVSAEAKEGKNKWLGPYRVLASDGLILQIDVDSKPKLVHRHHVVKAKIRPSHLDKDALDLLDDPDPAPAAPSPSAEPPSPAPTASPSPAPPREVPRRSGRPRRQPDRYGTSS